jgi:TRAP transporter TAXI family solute receptor
MRPTRMRPAGATLAILVGALGCHAAEVATERWPAPSIRMVTGPLGGGSQPLGDEIADALTRSMDDLAITTVHTQGAVSNIHAIQQGRAELGLTFADVAYLGFSGQLAPNVPPFDQLRGIAVLQVTPVALVVRPNLSVRGPQDLRGHRVGVGPAGSGTAVTARLILRGFGLEDADLHTEEIDFREGVARLLRGELDALFDNAISRSDALKQAADGGAHFVPIEGPAAERLRRDYPFFRAAVIPSELYGITVHTVGVDGLLICRSSLEETLVYELTRQLFASLKSLGRGALRFMDVKQAPATPVPLHAGAIRYYRERELSR